MALAVRKVILSGVAAAALTGGAFFGWSWWTHGRFIESTDNAYVHSDITIVAPKVAGYVREVRVTDNQKIAVGDVLVVLEDRDYRAQLAQADAAVAAQKAALESNSRTAELQRSLIAQADAELTSADAERQRAALEFQRAHSLAADKWGTRQRLEEAEAALHKADAAVLKARAALAATKDQAAVINASRNEIMARLQQAEAAQTAARNDLDNTVLRAAVDGVVGNRGVQVGQFARTGQQLLSLVPLPDVYIVANFKETQLSRMRPGQTVTLEVDAFPHHSLTGRVESFSPASGSQFSLLPPENATGNFTKIVQRVPVRIAVPRDNPLSGLLRPGLSVVAAVDTQGAEDTPHPPGAVFGAVEPPSMVAAR
ncbi:membrane fusion protein (multidrug efflux system) [Azospirillum fermentarium]|uniref:HlyD family secretion protein n=1 Tax=Azospirillum fermentarium TaxID=1233114 RepID=UPI0022266011|nr:HlyD family secretion protein [Azospirillum fermentarium]MCW2244943.1 membrane fusion protein (multidrug efflux system) [Azospirillum fermentarium]